MMNLGKVKAAGPVAEFGETRVRELVQECLLG
jgi:branched-chain amino acid transport system ATP-binding protein/neutral amino acid transport system ATP-binding protein